MTATTCFPGLTENVSLPSRMALPSTNTYACFGITLIFNFPSCAKPAVAQKIMATTRVNTYPSRRISVSPKPELSFRTSRRYCTAAVLQSYHCIPTLVFANVHICSILYSLPEIFYAAKQKLGSIGPSSRARIENTFHGIGQSFAGRIGFARCRGEQQLMLMHRLSQETSPSDASGLTMTMHGK